MYSAISNVAAYSIPPSCLQDMQSSPSCPDYEINPSPPLSYKLRLVSASCYAGANMAHLQSLSAARFVKFLTDVTVLFDKRLINIETELLPFFFNITAKKRMYSV